MKTLGLLGGMSWESTATYYQQINRRVREIKGGLHSAPLVMYSFDFAKVAELQHHGKWDEAGLLLNESATRLKLAGADAIVLCTNTMHFVSHGIEGATELPLLHIADFTAERIVQAGFKRVGLLGTRFTMEKEFYRARLTDKFGLDVVVPGEQSRVAIHDVIYNELVNGVIKESSREIYQRVISELADAGAECLILGCTEIGLLVDETRSALPIFDTTTIHAIAAADWAMRDEIV